MLKEYDVITERLAVFARCLLAALVGQLSQAAHADATSCAPVEGIQSICGLVAPEDIERTPDNRFLVFGSMEAPGGLFLLDPADDSVRPLFAGELRRIEPESGWGDPACPALRDQQLLAHGIDVRSRPDGRWQLLVVNHQARESVEFLELRYTGDEHLEAVWRGCVEAPPLAQFNDVAGLDDGAFLVTHMADADYRLLRLVQALVGIDTGYVYRWLPGSGFSVMPGSEGRLPNGITVAADGGSYYLNEYFGDRVRWHSLPDGALLGEVAVQQPDNSAWTEDGQLLVASHPVGVLDLLQALEQGHEQPSELAFEVIAIDPDSLEAVTVLSREGPPMGAGTVALQHGPWLYIGSFIGDRIIKVPAAGLARP